MKEALQKKMPLKLFCEKHAKEFRKYGGMWRDWINDSKEGTENSVAMNTLWKLVQSDVN